MGMANRRFSTFHGCFALLFLTALPWCVSAQALAESNALKATVTINQQFDYPLLSHVLFHKESGTPLTISEVQGLPEKSWRRQHNELG
jgi:hypothetical protein